METGLPDALRHRMLRNYPDELSDGTLSQSFQGPQYSPYKDHKPITKKIRKIGRKVVLNESNRSTQARAGASTASGRAVSSGSHTRYRSENDIFTTEVVEYSNDGFIQAKATSPSHAIQEEETDSKGTTYRFVGDLDSKCARPADSLTSTGIEVLTDSLNTQFKDERAPTPITPAAPSSRQPSPEPVALQPRGDFLRSLQRSIRHFGQPVEAKTPVKATAPFGLKEIGFYREENEYLREQVHELQSQLYENRNAYKFLLQDYENALH